MYTPRHFHGRGAGQRRQPGVLKAPGSPPAGGFEEPQVTPFSCEADYQVREQLWGCVKTDYITRDGQRTLDRVTEWNEVGLQISQERFVTPEYAYRYFYDEAKLRVRIERTIKTSGTLQTSRYVWAGRQLFELYNDIDYERLGLSTERLRSRYERDEQGCRVKKTDFRGYIDDVASELNTTTIERNEHSLPVREVYDALSDGVIERSETKEWAVHDRRWRLVRLLSDEGDMGTDSEERSYQDGRLDTINKNWNDGETIQVATHHYDSLGRLTLREEHRGPEFQELAFIVMTTNAPAHNGSATRLDAVPAPAADTPPPTPRTSAPLTSAPGHRHPALAPPSLAPPSLAPRTSAPHQRPRSPTHPALAPPCSPVADTPH